VAAIRIELHIDFIGRHAAGARSVLFARVAIAPGHCLMTLMTFIVACGYVLERIATGSRIINKNQRDLRDESLG
jgi:hypothetical protein